MEQGSHTIQPFVPGFNVNTPHATNTATVCANDHSDALCSGCGVCAGICPTGNLRMRWTPEGLLLPHSQSKCAETCRLCLQACPFQNSTENEDTLAYAQYATVPGIKRTPETGYFLDAWVGHAEGGFRERGTSGGLASWFLTSLLERGLADFIVCVGASRDPDRLFTYQICANPNEVRAAAKSKYYPVEISDAVTQILHTHGRYAVIGLPCTIKALRLAAKLIPRLRERIVFHAGLVCGQTKSRAFTEYLIAQAGGDKTPFETVEYRGKRMNRPATDYAFHILDARGNVLHSLGCLGKYASAWSSGMFTPAACCFCDDVFAETADIVFMDAWLPTYASDPRGTSLMLVRSNSALDLVGAAESTNQVFLRQISLAQVIASQVVVIEQKRTQLGYRLELARRKGRTLQKRIPPTSRLPFLAAKLCKAREALRVHSHRAWNEAATENCISVFDEVIRPRRDLYARWVMMSHLGQRMRTLPTIILNRIKRLGTQ